MLSGHPVIENLHEATELRLSYHVGLPQEIEAFSKALNTAGNLKKLILDQVRIIDKDLRKIFIEGLSKLQLDTLIVSNQYELHDDQWEILAAIISANPLKHLQFGGSPVYARPVMLDTDKFSAALVSCKTLTSVHVSTYAIEAGKFNNIIKSLKQLSNLEKLELYKNALDDAVAINLKELLLGCQRIKTLSISANHFSDKGIKTISEGLMHHPNLQSLNLSINQLRDEAVVELVTIFETLPALLELNLENNYITVAGASKLLEAIKDNLTVQKLMLNDNDNSISSKLRKKIDKILLRNKQLASCLDCSTTNFKHILNVFKEQKINLQCPSLVTLSALSCIEHLRTNRLSISKSKLPDPLNMMIEPFIAGDFSKSPFALFYQKSASNEAVVKEYSLELKR